MRNVRRGKICPCPLLRRVDGQTTLEQQRSRCFPLQFRPLRPAFGTYQKNNRPSGGGRSATSLRAFGRRGIGISGDGRWADCLPWPFAVCHHHGRCLLWATCGRSCGIGARLPHPMAAQLSTPDSHVRCGATEFHRTCGALGTTTFPTSTRTLRRTAGHRRPLHTCRIAPLHRNQSSPNNGTRGFGHGPACSPPPCPAHHLPHQRARLGVGRIVGLSNYIHLPYENSLLLFPSSMEGLGAVMPLLPLCFDVHTSLVHRCFIASLRSTFSDGGRNNSQQECGTPP